jgi:hypothetical protein
VKAWEFVKLAGALLVDPSDLLAVEEREQEPLILWRTFPQNPKEAEANFLNRCRQYAMLEELGGLVGVGPSYSVGAPGFHCTH